MSATALSAQEQVDQLLSRASAATNTPTVTLSLPQLVHRQRLTHHTHHDNHTGRDDVSGLRLLIIDNYDSFTHNLATLVESLTETPPLILYNDAPLASFIALLPYVDAILISPGPGRSDCDSDIGVCGWLLRHYCASMPPVMGVCLGLQALVTTSGGAVTHAAAVMHGRLSLIYHNHSGLFANIPQSFHAIRYNSLIADIPSFPHSLLTVTAVSDSGEIMGVNDRSGRIHTVQFHPESVCSEYGSIIFRNFIDIVIRDSRWIDRYDEDRRIERCEVRIPARYVSSHTQSRSLSQSAEPVWFAPIVQQPPSPSLTTLTSKSRYALVHHSLPLPAIDSEQLFTALFAANDNCWWLDSSLTENNRARFSFMGDQQGPLATTITYQLADKTLSQRSRTATATRSLTDSEDFFSELESLTNQRKIQSVIDWETHQSSPAVTALPFPFHGGWVGYISYELRRECEAGSDDSYNDSGSDSVSGSEEPDAVFLFVDRFLAIDHRTSTVHLVALVDASVTDSEEKQFHCPEFDWISDTKRTVESLASQPNANLARLAGMIANHSTASGSSSSGSAIDWQFRHSRESYIALIDQCLKEIHDGESYELCLTNQMLTHIAGADTVDAYHFYQLLRTLNPAPYASYFRLDSLSFSIVSSSPERFLRVSNSGECECRPIKGTMARNLTDPVADAQNRLTLDTSEKDYSENLMIVDLIRNDLGKVCMVNSVSVSALMECESYATLHTLVSTVRGSIDPMHSSPVMLLQSCFPAGSMTGAPKLRSCRILAAMEAGPRGVYSGCIGYISLPSATSIGALDMNVVIRTAIVRPSSVSIGVGGAIVAASDPVGEWDEIELKAKALKRALSIAVSTQAQALPKACN